ncbi:MAG: tyrosine-type recombinase/integrase [Sulfuricella sp.]|nr:tyrosine-type recombinase/integrase [Sulfuricella sp.]
MFQELFKDPHAIQRKLTGPLLDARLRFLTHCAEQGFARGTLREIAIYQSIVIDYLKLSDTGSVTRAEIEAAARRWAERHADTHSTEDASSPRSKARFINHAIHWLGFLGRLETTVSPPHPFVHFVAEFADFMREERGLSPETINYRCREVDNYLAQLCGQQRSLSDLTITHIDEVLLYRVNEAGYARCTVKTHASTLRAFFRYAEQRGWCQCGLADAIKAPRVFRLETLPFSPSWEDVQRLLASSNGARPVDIRDRAILLLLAVYGLRAGEVQRLQLKDLDWEHELLHIRRGKRGPVQQLPLSHTVGEAILRYLREVRPRTTCREVFLTIPVPFRPLTSGVISQIVSHRWQPLNVTLEHRGSHSLRHACATRLINQGVSLKEIGDQLGHRSLEATRIYTKVDLAHLREVADLNLGGLLCD